MRRESERRQTTVPGFDAELLAQLSPQGLHPGLAVRDLAAGELPVFLHRSGLRPIRDQYGIGFIDENASDNADPV